MHYSYTDLGDQIHHRWTPELINTISSNPEKFKEEHAFLAKRCDILVSFTDKCYHVKLGQCSDIQDPVYTAGFLKKFKDSEAFNADSIVEFSNTVGELCSRSLNEDKRVVYLACNINYQDFHRIVNCLVFPHVYVINIFLVVIGSNSLTLNYELTEPGDKHFNGLRVLKGRRPNVEFNGVNWDLLNDTEVYNGEWITLEDLKRLKNCEYLKLWNTTLTSQDLNQFLLFAIKHFKSGHGEWYIELDQFDYETVVDGIVHRKIITDDPKHEYMTKERNVQVCNIRTPHAYIMFNMAEKPKLLMNSINDGKSDFNAKPVIFIVADPN